MRFRDMVRVQTVFKKGTSRRKRRRFTRFLDAFSREHSAALYKATRDAQFRALCYGQSGVQISWEQDELKFEVTSDS